jgi:hypothetical protein
MRTIHAAASLAAALALVSGTAGAQKGGGATVHGAAQQGQKPAPLILEKQQLGTAAFAMAARDRMRSGDCAGALDAFDAALEHSIDASLRRDRGLCHEQLGHPYPAIDDYRAYLTADPDAPDAEGIRGRLARLEQDTLGKSSQNDDQPPGATGGSASGDAVVGSASVSATVNGTAGASADAPRPSNGPPPDSMDAVQHDDDTMRSPLRMGKGFSFAPYFAEHKWFDSGSSFGDSYTWAECVGLQLRYSFGRTATVFVEGAYQLFNSTAGSTSQNVGTISGLDSQVGLELRFPLDSAYDNQLIVAPGIGFDHISVSSPLANSSSTSEGAIVPRARFGWRHMVDRSASIDLALDAGMGKFALYDGDFPFGGAGSETALIGLDLGLVWGL